MSATTRAEDPYTAITEDLTYSYDGSSHLGAWRRPSRRHDGRADGAPLRPQGAFGRLGTGSEINGDACPIFPGKRYEDWNVADPAGQPVEVVRDIRDDIQARVTTLLREILT